MLGPLLFNINICDMFFEKYECYIASYVYENIFHTSGSDLAPVFSKLKSSTDGLFTCFMDNY